MDRIVSTRSPAPARIAALLALAGGLFAVGAVVLVHARRPAAPPAPACPPPVIAMAPATPTTPTTPTPAAPGHWTSQIPGMLGELAGAHVIRTTAELPRPVIDLIVGKDQPLADPDGKWETTDVIMDEKTPRRRLVWAVADGPFWLVHYEAGGIGRSAHVLLVRNETYVPSATGLWHAVVHDVLPDPKALMPAMDRGEVKDDPRYYW